MGPTQTWCLLLCYNKLCITPFISRWTHMVLLHKRRSCIFHICLGFLSSPPRKLFQILVKKGQYRLSSAWCCSVLWDAVVLVLVLFLINVELKLLNCCLLPLSGQKLFQPRHDACFFVTTKLCITPFISRWKHMLSLRPLSPGTVYAFC